MRDQYEAFPYPARDPADEAKRLITGSPSHPLEMDHCLWGGARDWSKPLRVLVAGGGTGDGLIQLAQMMASANRPAQITYIDLSTAARAVAGARARMRNLTNITFHTGSLLDAPDFGPFDYIDCCGVLHHLPDPAAGFTALRAALAPHGGLGFMVYAPYGRSGVYPLQEAFGALFADMPASQRVTAAKSVLATLPAGHPFKCNPNLGDHTIGDAEFYDLLLHSQDRAFDVPALLQILNETGWELASFAYPGLYDLARLAPAPEGMPATTAMAVAEKLRGTIKTHVGYARAHPAPVPDPDTRIPHLHGVPAAKLAQAIANGRAPAMTVERERVQITLPPETAPLIAQIDGRQPLARLYKTTGLAPTEARALWSLIESQLSPWGVLLYSRFLV
ncbi:class I SAM-dependent methyltransferase [Octadecabacter sp. R77987]|uniref:class I SAM-dependent methyltransferase n=1 Tax=Octadecabacter sp. R77987 TaxID=3093874 RepID=UPI0036730D44